MVPYGEPVIKCAKVVAYPAMNEMLHSQALEPECVKVQIDHVLKNFKNLPLYKQTDEHSILSDAEHSFTQWPRLYTILDSVRGPPSTYVQEAVAVNEPEPELLYEPKQVDYDPYSHLSNMYMFDPVMIVENTPFSVFESTPQVFESTPQPIPTQPNITASVKATKPWNCNKRKSPDLTPFSLPLKGQPRTSNDVKKKWLLDESVMSKKKDLIDIVLTKPENVQKAYMNILTLQPFESILAMVEPNIFEADELIFNFEFDDLEKIFTNGWVDVVIITLYLRMLHVTLQTNRANKCAFINPNVTC